MRSDGFSLLVAVCNVPVDRERYLDMLAESLPDTPLHRVRFTAETVDPLAETLAQVSGNPPGVVALLDLERAVPSSAEYHPVLATLNLQRQLWVERLPQPVVLWVSDYLLAFLGREAPDFMDRRSATLFFAAGVSSNWGPWVWDSGIEPQERPNVTRGRRRLRGWELEGRLGGIPQAPGRIERGARAEWLLERGHHFAALGAYDDAERVLRDAVETARGGDRADVQALSLVALGRVLLKQGRADDAQSYLEEAHQTALALGRRDVTAMTLTALAFAARKRGDLHDAEALLGDWRTALAGSDPASRDTTASTTATVLQELGAALWERGDLDGAARLSEDLLRFARTNRLLRVATYEMLRLGVIDAARGRHNAAERRYRAALEDASTMADSDLAAIALLNLGHLRARQGDIAAAETDINQALTHFIQLGHREGEARALRSLASVSDARGELAIGERYRQRADALSAPEDRPPLTPRRRIVRGWQD